MINLDESILTIPDAAGTLPPRGGKRKHVATLYRWIMRGIKGIRLESVVLGGQRYTSREALQRFADATTAAASGEPPPQAVRTPAQRERDIRAAERELSEAGI